MARYPIKSSLVVIALLAWIAFVLGGYYLYHKPFALEQLLVWTRAAYQTVVCAAILLSAGGLGVEILSRLGFGEKLSITKSTGLGLGVLATVFLGLGSILGVRWFFSIFLLGAVWIACRRSIRRWLEGLGQVILEIAPQNRYASILAALLLLLLLCSWLVALSPPIAFDALVYHLSLPLQYLEQSRFHYIPSNVFWGMPQLGEMLYTFAMSLAGLEAGAALGWFLGCFALLGLAEILRSHLSRPELWVTLSTSLSGFTFVESLAWAYVDWITFFWGVCVLFALKEAFVERPHQNVLLAGVFSGFALGTKYTAGVIAVAAAFAIVFLLPQTVKPTGEAQQPLSATWSSKVGTLLLFIFALLTVSFPWWLKNLLAVGQPFYPLLFPAGEMSALRIGFYAGLQPWGSWWTSLLLPFSATFLGVEGKEGFSASIGPLFLLLVPFSFLPAEAGDLDRKLIRLSALFGLVGWLFWGIGARLAGYLIQTRLYWSIMPSLAILSGFGYRKLHALDLKPVRIWFVANGIVLMVIVLTTVEVLTSTVQKRVLEYIAGRIDAQAYLTHNLGWHIVAAQWVRQLGGAGSTLLLFEPRSLYCLPNCESDELLDEWFVVAQDPSNAPEKVIRAWKERGFQRVLIFRQGAEFLQKSDQRYPAAQWKLFERVVAQLPKEQDFGGAYSLYTLP